MLKRTKNNGFYRLINQKTGKVKILKHYQNGMVHGKIIYYWDNGQIRLIGQYNNMKRVGLWKTYDSNGSLIVEENYNIPTQNNESQLVLLPL